MDMELGGYTSCVCLGWDLGLEMMPYCRMGEDRIR